MKTMKIKNRHEISDKMKVHLRVRQVGAHEVRIITLRPDLQVSISNNHFHGTWHIIGNERTARLLSRLLWGLSFQKTENTLILIDGSQLTPNPFDASPSLPFIIALGDTFTLRARELKQIRQWSSRGRLGPPDRTIRWHTFSLDDHFNTLRYQWDRSQETVNEAQYFSRYTAEDEQLRAPPTLQEVEGALFFRGNRMTLREAAFTCCYMRQIAPHDLYAGSYEYLTYHLKSHGYDHYGEVQFVADYHQLLSAAKVAKRELGLSGNTEMERLEIGDYAKRVVLKRDRQRYAERARGSIADVAHDGLGDE